MNNIETIRVKFLEVEQPIGIFYIASINWKDLFAISYADVREIKDTNDDSIDSYLGIQRTVSRNRVKEISKYVRTLDATFPTSVILHIDSKSYFKNGKEINTVDDILDDDVDEIDNIYVDNDTDELVIRKKDTVAKVLDGQHRIEGLKEGYYNLHDHDTDFQFNVTIFVDLDIDDQAQIFSVINKAQTKVNKSLVYDLYEYATSRSPQKTAHDIVRLLNKAEESPFYKKVKLLGTARNRELETVTQATIAEIIISFISSDPMSDRDVIKRNKKSIFGSRKIQLGSASEQKKRMFRKLFINDKDEIIYQNIYNYFKAVQQKWPIAWDEISTGNILNRSTGIIALFRLFRDVYLHLKGGDDRLVKFSEYFDLLQCVKSYLSQNVGFSRVKHKKT